MPDPKQINRYQKRLATHRSTLAHLLQQAAQHGGVALAPPVTANGIAEARTEIRRCKDTLRGWGVSVDDLPDDTGLLPELDTNTEDIIAQRQELVQNKQRELVSFRAMLTVLESFDATKWIIYRIADVISDRKFVRDDSRIELVVERVRDRCLERIAVLEEELAELVPVDKVFVDDSPADIFNWYRGCTNPIERERLWKSRYYGKYIRSSDYIKRISIGAGLVDIFLSHIWFSLDIDDTVVDDLREGKFISFTGRINAIPSYPNAIHLIDCQIIGE